MADSTPDRRYFDYAATSFPKPPGVADAVRDYIEHVGASAGRGAYREALRSRVIIDDCRDALRELFGLRPEDHVLLTLNGTDALNIAIKGAAGAGGHIVTTAMDHNSVLRPLAELTARGEITHTVVPVTLPSTRLDPRSVIAAITPQTTLVAVNQASNVTGVLQPLAEIAAVCRERGILFLVDGAQSAGHVPIDMHAAKIDLLAMPGHKGLLGPLGTGVLLMRAGVEQRLRTWREGGTGSESEKPTQPQAMPDRFESGSHNAAGIAGLLVAVRWLIERGVARIRAHEHTLNERLLRGLGGVPGLTVYGPTATEQRVGVFSIRMAGIAPEELAVVLEQQFGVLARAGLHCAPFAHRTIGTDADGGTTRLSTGVFTTVADVDVVVEALQEVAQAFTPATTS